MGDRLLALDLGTTSVCALVVDPGGAVLGRARSPLTSAFPEPGRVEQDPDEMLRVSVETLRRALAEAGLAADALGALGGLGVVSQRATVVAWRASDGAPLTPAIGWQDRRTAARCAELRERGIPIDTLPSATKLEWWLRHDDAVRRAADAGDLRLGTPDAWLTDRLTGGEAFVTDPGCAAATALFDPRAGAWSPGLLDLFGIEVGWLPRIVPTAEVGGTTPGALLGGPIAVAARAGDQQAATFAQGVHAAGEAKLTLGTSAMLDVHTGAAPARAPRGTYPLPLWWLPGTSSRDEERAFCLEATVVTAGAAVDWLVSVGLLPSPDALDATAASVDDTAGVAFVPALQGLGSPWLDPGARGLIGGLTRGAGRGHLARALVEGLAQRCCDLLDPLPLADDAPLRVDGGLARSDLTLAAIADASGRTLHRAAETETTALGAAFLAGLATGALETPGDVTDRLAVGRAFAPRLDADARARARERWRDVVARARTDWSPG